MKTFRLFVILTLCALAVGSCKQKKKSDKWQDTITSGLIPIAVDDAFEPIMQTQLDVFETVYPYSGVMPSYVSEVEALQMLFDDSVRLAIVSRKLTDGEKEAYKAKKRFPREWHFATDAIALITHKSNPDSIISVHTLQKILTGKITKWSELNPKSPLKGDINVVFDNKQSGTLRYIVDSLCKGEPLSANVFAEKKNKEVVSYVEESPHALGIIGVNWVGDASDTTRMSFHKRVTVMAVSRMEFADSENSYKPYQAYIALKHYPLTREVYAVLNDPKGGLSTGLTSFLCSQRGQYIIMKSGLVPATQQVRIVERASE